MAQGAVTVPRRMPSARLSHTLRGALAGTVAAGVWAAQQPLDKRVTGVAYDDCELLGSAVVRGRWAYPAGVAMHLANGAVFGAIYSRVGGLLPGPRAAHDDPAQKLHVVVVDAEHALVERLLRRPDAGGDHPCERAAHAASSVH